MKTKAHSLNFPKEFYDLKAHILSCFFLLILCSMASVSSELPTSPSVVSGNVSFVKEGSTLNINALTEKSIVNYESFGIGANESVNFNLPSAGSAILNRVIGNSPSEIYGSINSNGHVFLINPNGILFGSSSSVNVNSITASTLDTGDEDFLEGKYTFLNSGNYSLIKNQGSIKSESSINLISSSIKNEGELISEFINLGIGDKATIILEEGISTKLVIEENLKEKVVESSIGIHNTGLMQGENILIQALLEEAFYSSVVNNEGIISATSLENKEGRIELYAKSVEKLATLDNAGYIGSQEIIVAGDVTKIREGAEIEGQKILIGGDYQGKSDFENSLYTRVEEGTNIGTIEREGKVIISSSKRLIYITQT